MQSKKIGGVVGVTNYLDPAARRHVRHQGPDRGRFGRNAEIEANGTRACMSNSKVVLEDDVCTWNERHAAEQAACAVPGVTIVENHLHVG